MLPESPGCDFFSTASPTWDGLSFAHINALLLYFIGEYKRVNGKGYSFVIPAEWVGDTFVELAKAQRAAGSLDYGMRRGGGGSSTLPDSGTSVLRGVVMKQPFGSAFRMLV